ncbi:MAG TPA: Hsp20/alpha crystallin family protein [Candidatus Nanopelagicales bacterium]|nr:Hsp20/alpha crystallin family protein [Candidatus Nanopelagicales bacterium]
MAVLRFDPFRELDRMTEQMLGVPAGSARAPRFMPMDLYRSGDHYVLHADLPGVDPGSVDVSVDNGTLTIRAQRSGRTEDGVEWLASERFTGSYMRQLALGDGIDADAIHATYENGVLTLTLPLAARAKPRRIDIAVTGDAPVVVGETEQQAVTSG